MTDQKPLDKGTYVLLLQLKKAQSIEVGQFGTFDFKQGWYAYVGSAFGAGGMRARTARHLRRGKKHHWHVDYFREFADVVEIWSVRSKPAAEHDVARLLAGMDGVTAPVPGFGSQDCEAGCPAHFFQLEKRPRASALRAALGRQYPQHGPLSVETISTRDDFVIGKRSLHMRRKAARHDGDDSFAVPANCLTRFSTDPIGCQIAELLASELRIPVSKLKELAKFAEAAEQIVANCQKHEALSVIFSRDNPQEKDAVFQLSRTSPERQRYRIRRVAVGYERSIAPRSTDDVFDTLGFYEVTSRLGRARGAISGSLWLLENALDAHLTEAIACDILATIADCEREAGELFSILQIPVKLARAMRRNGYERQQPRKLTLERVPGQLKSALALIQKNVRDFPQLAPDRQPTPDERTNAGAEIVRILGDCRSVRTLLKSRLRAVASAVTA